MRDYIRRVVDRELDQLLPALPAISLEGAKGVGKTETALQRAKTVFRLDDSQQRTILQAHPRRILEITQTPVLIDEWQRVPEIWDTVRRAVDEQAEPGRFLMTGSVAPQTNPMHSGAGRIVTVRMRPMTLSERGVVEPSVSLADLLSGKCPDFSGETSFTLTDYAREITASGLPGLRALTGRPQRAQLESYLGRLAEREFPEAGLHVRKPQAVRRWMAAYAAASSTTSTFEKIRDAATSGEGDKPSKSTVAPYRELLERLWIIDPVEAWAPGQSIIGRLAQPPKHQMNDPALAARLMGLDANLLLTGQEPLLRSGQPGSILGRLFESLVTMCLRVYAQLSEARLGHLRTKGGRHEVDILIERADQRLVAIEVKLAGAVTDEDTKHLVWMRNKLGDYLLDALIVNTGRYAYRRDDGIGVVPLALLGP